MKRTLTWLHLSDLHARHRDDWEAKEITQKLVDDLKLMQKDHGLRPDFLFFTGDLVFGAIGTEKMPDQYHLVRMFLDNVRKAFDPEIPLRDVYLVPGNHDVDRGEVTPDQTLWLRDSSRKIEDIMAPMQDVKKQWRSWMERLVHYRRFLTSYGLVHLIPDDPHLIWADAREVAGMRVGIAGLNTAWSCVDKNDKANLWFGADWQIAQVKEKMGLVDFAFGLFHHPANWFTTQEDPAAGRRLREEFHILLHGHEHLQWIDQSKDDRLQLSSGACYQCSWMDNGYSMGVLDLESRTGSIYLREWENQGRGWVEKNIAGKTKNGVHYLQPLSWLQVKSQHVHESQTGLEFTPQDTGLTVEEHYTQRFCQHVVEKQDFLELFGCDIPRELQRHQLSVAYVSLNLSPDEDPKATTKKTAKGKKTQGKQLKKSAIDEPNDDCSDFEAATASFEVTLDRVLSRDGRLIVRGPAGAGKSTLLRWCAIHAARVIQGRPKLFSGPEYNPSWRTKIPLLIRLRDCRDGKLTHATELPRFLARHLPSAPADWMVNILRAGQGLFLLDGVDELHRDLRLDLGEDIAEMIRTYPECSYVITTRPGAVDRGWLEHLNFTEAQVEPMGRRDREEFIDKWYASAALELTNRPRPGEDLRQTTIRLKAELIDQPELGVLATNPLLCAMICALYRERQECLPETPAELCEALCHMLLHRRESETPGLSRGEHFPGIWRALQYTQKKGILAALACYMVTNGFSSLANSQASKIIDGILDKTPGRNRNETTDVFQALMERSGLLRIANDDSFEFLHNTLKEYLAACAMLEDGDWELLANHAADSIWQPVILFCLALGPEPFNTKLVRCILTKLELLESEPKKRKNTPLGRAAIAEKKSLEFMMMRCRAAAKWLDRGLCDAADNLLGLMLPPANLTEAAALAQLGPRVLTYGEDKINSEGWWSKISAGEVIASLRLLSQIGGARAMAAFKAFKSHHTFDQRAIMEWVKAAHDLFGDTKLPMPFVVAKDSPFSLHFAANDWLTDLTWVRDLHYIRGLRLNNSRNLQNLAPIRHCGRLQFLDISKCPVADIRVIESLRHLVRLDLSECPISDLAPLKSLLAIEHLDLNGCSNLTEANAIEGKSKLESLGINGCRQLNSLEFLRDCRSLQSLHMIGCDLITDLSPLNDLKGLQSLSLDLSFNSILATLDSRASLQNLVVYSNDFSSNLTGIEKLKHLRTLYLFGKLHEHIVSSLNSAINLRHFSLRNCAEPLELCLFKNRRTWESLCFSECKNLKNLDGCEEMQLLHEVDLFNCFGLEDISGLKRLAQLQKISVYNCPQISEAKLAEIKASLPKCMISRY